jgi:hypothetical protein
MKTSLLKGLDEEQKKEVRGQFKGSYLFRQQVVKILNEERDGVLRLMVNNDFSSPNWSVEQAHNVARVKEIERLISLFEN